MVQKIVDPNFNIKTFNVKCDNELSSLAKTIIKSFKLIEVDKTNCKCNIMRCKILELFFKNKIFAC